MTNRERVEQVAQDLQDAFQRGVLPRALAQAFIHKEIDSPTASWSWRNRLLAALRGHWDARGFRQWKAVGRSVRKGERAFHILGPVTRRAKEDDPERGIEEGDSILVGLRAIPVFGLSQTEGEPLPHEEQESGFFDRLPLVEVARSWGVRLTTFDARFSDRIGFFRPGESDPLIALGVENLATWAHELIHAAEARRGTLTPGGGQRLDNEVVAEFGGAVLLECLGLKVESDRGGAYEYIKRHADEHDRSMFSVLSELVDRSCDTVAFLLDAADQLPTEAPGQEPSRGRIAQAG